MCLGTPCSKHIITTQFKYPIPLVRVRTQSHRQPHVARSTCYVPHAVHHPAARPCSIPRPASRSERATLTWRSCQIAR